MSADTTTVVRWRVHSAKPRTRHALRPDDLVNALCWVASGDWKDDDASIRTCPKCAARAEPRPPVKVRICQLCGGLHAGSCEPRTLHPDDQREQDAREESA